jgi:hypothetical protein
MKIPTLILTAFVLVLILTGCNLTDDQKAKWSATGSYVSQRVASIALQTVINGAIAASDKDRNVDFTQGLAEGFRTQQGNLLTSGDIKEMVAIWTPKKPAFQALGNQLASVYAEAQPKTRQDAAEVLEEMATGLDAATKNQ